jgi:hypothetical protein
MAVTPYHDSNQRSHARLPPVLGLIGTLVLCAAAMLAHLSPEQLKPAAAVLWVLGFLTQAAAFILALAARRAD